MSGIPALIRGLLVCQRGARDSSELAVVCCRFMAAITGTSTPGAACGFLLKPSDSAGQGRIGERDHRIHA